MWVIEKEEILAGIIHRAGVCFQHEDGKIRRGGGARIQRRQYLDTMWVIAEEEVLAGIIYRAGVCFYHADGKIVSEQSLGQGGGQGVMNTLFEGAWKGFYLCTSEFRQA